MKKQTCKFVDQWRIPAGRFGDPAGIGACCALMCSGHAGYLVGQSIVIYDEVLNTTF
jgi:hypothetical protein